MAVDIFSGVQQTDKSIGDVGFKLPFFFRDARIFSIYLPAPVKSLCKLLTSEDLSPAQFLPGTGLVSLTAYEYRDTDAGPYNDFSVVIPLNSPRFPKLPLYNLLKSRSSGEIYNFLMHRGPTSEAAVRICREYFLFPVFHAAIDFSESDDWLTCDVKEDGELVCSLRGRKLPMKPTQKAERIGVLISTPQHPQAQGVDMNVVQSATTRSSSDAEVTLGSSHPIAVELSETLNSVKPRMYTYSPSCQFIAYGP